MGGGGGGGGGRGESGETFDVRVRRRGEIEGGATDEGGCETPGHAYEHETEGPAEDGGGGVG